MIVWVLTHEYPPNIIGGLGVVATNLVQAMAQQGTKLVVFTQNDYYKKIVLHKQSGVELISIPKDPTFFDSRNNSFRATPILSWLKNHNIPRARVIHVHSVVFGDFAQAVGRIMRVPVIYTCHSLTTHDLKNQLKLVNYSTKVIFPSRWLKNTLAHKYPSCTKKTVVIPNGVVPSPNLTPKPRTELAYIGRIVSSKGINELVKAIPVLAKRNKAVTLSVVGKGSPQHLEQIKKLVSKLGIYNQVHWKGFVAPARIPSIYHNYGAVIVPSTQESFCLVALEAMGNQVPLVSTRNSGLAEIVDNNVAEVIPRVTPQDISQAILNMWNKKELTDQRIKNGFAKSRKYLWRNIAHKYLLLFDKL